MRWQVGMQLKRLFSFHTSGEVETEAVLGCMKLRRKTGLHHSHTNLGRVDCSEPRFTHKHFRCPPAPRGQTKLTMQWKLLPGPSPYIRSFYQESLGSPNSFTVPASRLLSYLPSLSSQANASRGLLGCQATVKVGDSHCTSHSLSPVSTSAMSMK